MHYEYGHYEPVKNLFKLAQKIEEESHEIYEARFDEPRDHLWGLFHLLPKNNEHPFGLLIIPHTSVVTYKTSLESSSETDALVSKMEGRKVEDIELFCFLDTEEKIRTAGIDNLNPYITLSLKIEKAQRDNFLNAGTYRYHLGKNGEYFKEKELIDTDVSDPNNALIVGVDQGRCTETTPKELEAIGMFLLELRERVGRFKPELSE